MLRRLEIENYGLIARAEIDFSDGATMFTGETGSGKTMLLGALAFVLGARTSGDVVRLGASKAVVTLTFDPEPELRARLCADGFEIDAGESASIVREVNGAGKSILRVNGRASTAAAVRECSDSIAEIIGQHEAQRLLIGAYQLQILDRYGGDSSIAAIDCVAAAHERAVQCKTELTALERDARKAAEGYDDARFSVDEIDSLAPKLGEDVRLSERRRYLDNVERIANALRSAHDALGADESSAAHALGSASATLAAIADINDDLREMREQAASLQTEARELATRIARALDGTEQSAGELDAINARLDALDRLKRKYGGSIERVLEHAEHARAVVGSVDLHSERAANANAALADARASLESAASTLTARRCDAAQRLCASVLAELSEIALAAARFDVAFVARDNIVADGAESVEFMFAANPGEPMRPLARAASGGELSRVLLALVVVLANARERTALVFDEIDTGIGGVTATAVGVRIGRLARSGQVVCVTHLAQLAAWADAHYLLEKHEDGENTIIAVRKVAADARTAELARMLSGESHAIALKHAAALLRVRDAIKPQS